MDSLWDPRRAALIKTALESGNDSFNWDLNFAEIYEKRRFDYFHHPELGITQEKYLENYKNRSLNEFAQGWTVPSKLIYNMFKIVRVLEFGVGQVLSMDKFHLTVNTWPYEMSDYLMDELASTIRGSIPFTISLSFVSFEDEKISPSLLHGYDYVFIYDWMTNPNLKNYWSAYGNTHSTNTRFMIPDVLISEDKLPEGMKSEEPITILNKMNIAQGGKVTWVAHPKTIYDYKK